ncbi:hypothetical protein DEU38_106213 [Rhodococcus sp. AG1013]|nr:hypothetical protein DEU38_106213 [Rhodococcus sp. AG1013]
MSPSEGRGGTSGSLSVREKNNLTCCSGETELKRWRSVPPKVSLP